MNNRYFNGFDTNFKVQAGFALSDIIPPQFDTSSRN